MHLQCYTEATMGSIVATIKESIVILQALIAYNINGGLHIHLFMPLLTAAKQLVSENLT
jgi:hypothetical protein